LIANLGRSAPRDREVVSAFAVIASQAKQSMQQQKERMDFFAEPVIGRAFARPVGSQRRTGGASRREVANVYLDFTLYLFISSMRADGDASAAP
jgi:hypothetical protein